MVIRSHPQPGIDLTYVKQGMESNGDAGDQYTGLDRFGRVVDQRWIDTSSGTATDRFQYGYDRDGNRLYRDNLVDSTFGELYSYDGLNQLASFDRGTLNGTKDGLTDTASRTQDWNYDALGNWDSVTTDGNAETRTANAQNEITSISSATTPTYDANGNMTGDETGRQFVYDAWNRLVEVQDDQSATLETFSYDGLNRRVTNTIGSTTTDLFYSSAWQVLEEKVGSNTTNRYVWSPVYVDAMVLRDRDTDANGSLDERLWVQQDANWNVTALLDQTGTIVERYAYGPYGEVTVLDTNWATDGDGESDVDWHYFLQGATYDPISNQLHFRLREYSATLGRFTTRDPISFRSGDINLYRMEGNNPINRLDPTGLQETNPFLKPLPSCSPRCTDGRAVEKWLADKQPRDNYRDLQDFFRTQPQPPPLKGYKVQLRCYPAAFSWLHSYLHCGIIVTCYDKDGKITKEVSFDGGGAASLSTPGKPGTSGASPEYHDPAKRP